MFQGLTEELQTPKDLLAKLQFDFTRIEANPCNIFAAFDFFVTAEHLHEWVVKHYPEWVDDKSIKNEESRLNIVSHIANGVKHFKATHSKHKSVKNVHKRKGAFQAEPFQSDAFDVGDLVIELKEDEAEKFGSEISVRTLAQDVVNFWTDKIRLKEGC